MSVDLPVEMTAEQRYLFDIYGFLHIESALSAQELEDARQGAQAYMECPADDLPAGFEQDERRFVHGFAFDRALERLVFHPSTWPIVLEFTNGRPRLGSGTLQADAPGLHTEALNLHCARDDFGWESTRYEVRHGRIYCDDFVVFPYLDDVYPGDGGLLVVPGSHKSQFERPRQLFDNGQVREPLPSGVINVQPKAGDMVVMTEGLTHGTLPWTADRPRRTLVLRYRPQHRAGGELPAEIVARLAPETQELVAPAHYTHTKEIAKQARVDLSS